MPSINNIGIVSGNLHGRPNLFCFCVRISIVSRDMISYTPPRKINLFPVIPETVSLETVHPVKWQIPVLPSSCSHQSHRSVRPRNSASSWATAQRRVRLWPRSQSTWCDHWVEAKESDKVFTQGGPWRQRTWLCFPWSVGFKSCYELKDLQTRKQQMQEQTPASCGMDLWYQPQTASPW